MINKFIKCLFMLSPVTCWAADYNTNFLNGNFFPLNTDAIAPALQVFSVLTLISLAPSILMMLTCFTKIIIVLSMLRTALGLQQTPPNMVLISISLFLTIYTMMPVGNLIYTNAYKPFEEKLISGEQALQAAKKPLQTFMLRQTREKDLQLLLEIAHEPLPARLEDINFFQLVPAFLLSELNSAFQIGFIIFLPFLLVDLIVSALLATMGMMMMPPTTLSLPIKILLFVLIDGWNLVIQTLVASIN